MAKQIEEFTLPQSSRGGKYDWDNWLDGNKWELEIGDDKDVQRPKYFAHQARMAAKRRNKHVVTCRISTKKGIVEFQAGDGVAEENGTPTAAAPATTGGKKKKGK